MVVTKVKEEVITSGESKSFAVKVSAKAFQVIISTQYSDLDRALVIELIQNAYDSHIKAGRTELPIEIQCPNNIDDKLIVTDYGTGMSHDFMMNRYTQVFDSTKDTSDNENGGYGWGRLVGLAFDGGKHYYKNGYFGEETYLVLIYPEWVVSVPNGEANSKGRAYKMKVLSKINNADIGNVIEKKPAYRTPKRDQLGRFSK